MTLSNFFKLHNGGTGCISIHQEPYVHENHRYTKTYFEEAYKEDVLKSETYKSIKNLQVDHFNVIGGGMYPVELCIYLQEEKNEM